MRKILWWRIRRWLIERLAGDETIAINVTVSKGSLRVDGTRPALFIGCMIIGEVRGGALTPGMIVDGGPLELRA